MANRVGHPHTNCCFDGSKAVPNRRIRFQTMGQRAFRWRLPSKYDWNLLLYSGLYFGATSSGSQPQMEAPPDATAAFGLIVAVTSATQKGPNFNHGYGQHQAVLSWPICAKNALTFPFDNIRPFKAGRSAPKAH